MEDTVLILQVLAGGLYLLNKVFLSFSKRARAKDRATAGRRWRIAAWAVYLGGLPLWIVIFSVWRNWIAATVEASGGPAMLLGLVAAIRGAEYEPRRWFNWFARASAVVGFAWSFYDFGGFGSLTQWLETAMVTGFLVGTNQLAAGRPSGYLWFVLMHLSCGALAGVQDAWWLVIQQALSLGFIADAYATHRRNQRVHSKTDRAPA